MYNIGSKTRDSSLKFPNLQLPVVLVCAAPTAWHILSTSLYAPVTFKPILCQHQRQQRPVDVKSLYKSARRKQVQHGLKHLCLGLWSIFHVYSQTGKVYALL
jgi:hypothetical protein